tara:strand:+ start:529 stop:1014 length:486 start_codon:yes stop_codon:yes gene_type:complete
VVNHTSNPNDPLPIIDWSEKCSTIVGMGPSIAYYRGTKWLLVPSSKGSPTKVGLLPGQVQTIKNGQITIGAVDGTIVVDDYAIEGPGPSWCRFGKAKDIILKIRYDDEPIIFRNTRFNNFSDIINRLSSMLAVYEENVNHQPEIKVLNQRIESPVIYDGKT